MSEIRVNGVPRTPPLSVSSTSTQVNHTGSWKYVKPEYHDRVAPCSVGCPTGVDIQGYMTFLREGQTNLALELLLRENPMPAITGRVCNHPCENKCNRSSFDDAVAIHAVERMLGDLALSSPLPGVWPLFQSERIAIVGSGPAGLACAYHLSRLGYHCQIFEREQKAGGMLRIGIPEYRLPRAVLDRQLEHYAAQGIVFNTNVRVGEDVSWEVLKSEFDAVFIASGAHVSKLLQLEGAKGDAVLSGLEFLRAVNRGERPYVGQRVVVIGGGNTAIDCARTALRLGAVVTVVYRRTREQMPAIAEEVDDAVREGVHFLFLAAPSRLVNAAGILTLECQRMELGEVDRQGRRSVVPSEQARVALPVDTIIAAIGEDVEVTALPLEVTKSGVASDEWGSSSGTFFLGGDVAGDNRTVATALGAGKRAAIGIERYLRTARGDHSAAPSSTDLRLGADGSLSIARFRHEDPVRRIDPRNEMVTLEQVNTSSFAHVERHNDAHPMTSENFGEANIGITAQEALAEAARCFQCGVCNACQLCQIYCSENAITYNEATGSFVIDLEHCKGCGVCAFECPRGAISMERVGPSEVRL